MGHIVNPISFRLGVTAFWRFNNVSRKNTKLKASFFFDKTLSSFLEWFFVSHTPNLYKGKTAILYKLFRHFDADITFQNKFCNFFYKRFNHIRFLLDCFIYVRRLVLANILTFKIKTKIKIVDGNNFFFFEDFLKLLILYQEFVIDCYYDEDDDIEEDEDLKDNVVNYIKSFYIPELSHFNIYRSGLYNTKIILFVSQPYLNTLLNTSLENYFDWSDFLLDDDNDFSKIFVEKNVLFNVLQNIDLKNKKRLKIKDYFSLRFAFLNNLYKFLNKNDFFYFEIFNNFKRSFFSFAFDTEYEGKENIWSINLSVLLLSFFLEKTWLFLLSRMFSLYLHPSVVFFRVKLIDSQVITTRLLYNFFCRNLRQRKPVSTILNMIILELRNQESLVGFKILTSGRFTRRERALYKWQVYERTPLSLYNSYLDYYSGFYKSRFGVCSFKFWIFKE